MLFPSIQDTLIYWLIQYEIQNLSLPFIGVVSIIVTRVGDISAGKAILRKFLFGIAAWGVSRPGREGKNFFSNLKFN